MIIRLIGLDGELVKEFTNIDAPPHFQMPIMNPPKLMDNGPAIHMGFKRRTFDFDCRLGDLASYQEHR